MAQNYVLMGYMGSGKSTVGLYLSNHLKCSYIDLDNYIEEQEKGSISKIIHDKGVIYFRKREHEYLNTLLESSGPLVLSLGGGTPCYHNNMNLIMESGQFTSIYLQSSVSFLTDRLFSQKSHRPLIAQIEEKSELAEFIGKHLLERSGFYHQADYTINVEDKSPLDIVNEIVSLR